MFSSGLFAFFRDSNGEPFTERDPATRWPKFYNEKSGLNWNFFFYMNSFFLDRLQVYTPSDQVLKEIVREDWKIRGGTISKSISILVTPKVQVNR